MVPCLKEAHCLHDAWTKLNIHPAKIMQVSLMRQRCHIHVNITVNNKLLQKLTVLLKCRITQVLVAK